MSSPTEFYAITFMISAFNSDPWASPTAHTTVAKFDPGLVTAYAHPSGFYQEGGDSGVSCGVIVYMVTDPVTGFVAAIPTMDPGDPLFWQQPVLSADNVGEVIFGAVASSTGYHLAEASIVNQVWIWR